MSQMRSSTDSVSTDSWTVPGLTPAASNLYALGLPVLRRRKSTFIHGIEDDAREVIHHLASYLVGDPRASRRAASAITSSRLQNANRTSVGATSGSS
jgi:hypothetical protein